MNDAVGVADGKLEQRKLQCRPHGTAVITSQVTGTVGVRRHIEAVFVELLAHPKKQEVGAKWRGLTNSHTRVRLQKIQRNDRHNHERHVEGNAAEVAR